MKSLDIYLGIIGINIKSSLAYIFYTWARIVVNILQIIVFYYIWMAVFNNNSAMNGVSKSQMVTYIILSRVIAGRLTFGINLHMSRLIQTGDIAIELLRPINFQFSLYLKRIGDFFASMIFEGLPGYRQEFCANWFAALA